jgi:hypothetical protein
VDVPDGIEPLVGYREWHAWTDLEGKPVLMSLYRSAVWPRREPMRAACLKNDLGLWVKQSIGEHQAPCEDCQCGLYAYRSPDFEPCAQSSDHRYVSGIVLGWGRYILGTNGWRTEYARPAAMMSAPGLERWIALAADLYELSVLDGWPEVGRAA